MGQGCTFGLVLCVKLFDFLKSDMFMICMYFSFLRFIFPTGYMQFNIRVIVKYKRPMDIRSTVFPNDPTVYEKGEWVC